MKRTNLFTTLIAAFGLFAQPLFAQSSSPSSGPSSLPFSFGAASSGPSSSAGFLPFYIGLGYGGAFGDMVLTDIATLEKLSGRKNTYLDLVAMWNLYETTAILMYWQLGLYSHKGKVERVTQPGGLVFPTTGNMRETGVFAGVGAQAPITQNANHTVFGSASVGYGKRKFDAFAGGFTGSESGMFWRAEAGVNFDLGNGFFLTPAVAVTAYDGDVISANNAVWLLRIGTKF